MSNARRELDTNRRSAGLGGKYHLQGHTIDPGGVGGPRRLCDVRDSMGGDKYLRAWLREMVADVIEELADDLRKP